MEHIIDFIALTNNFGMRLNREQFSHLVITLLSPFTDPSAQMLMPYPRIRCFHEISKLERNTCNLIQTAYLDEVEDLYTSNFEYLLKELLMHLESPKACIQILDTLRIASFWHE